MLKAIFSGKAQRAGPHTNRRMDHLHRPNMATHEADSEAGAGMITHFNLSIILSHYIYRDNSLYEYVTCILQLGRSKCMWLVMLAQVANVILAVRYKEKLI